MANNINKTSADTTPVSGMTFCNQCCAPMQLANCKHHKYYIVDPRDTIDPSIPTVDGRELLIEEMFVRLNGLLDLIEKDDDDVDLTTSKEFFDAHELLVEHWEWSPSEVVRHNPKAIVRRQNLRRQLPK